jgi:LytS/YehU family sensor histidine kinase
MNPHFIFNCLSSIQDYILGADVRNANLYLHKLSALIRKILQDSPHSYSTLKEEVGVLGLYMELEKLRLAHRMDYSIDVADDLRPSEILIPSLLLQPFAENAIQHGISPLQDRKGVIRIDFRRSGKGLICTIEDNGVGIHASQREKLREGHESMGLDIISNRIRILNAIRKEAVSLNIMDKSKYSAHEQGTIVRIYFSQ